MLPLGEWIVPTPRNSAQILRIKKAPKLMTDFEVNQFLKRLKSDQKQHTPTPLATITYETLRYLEDLPCFKQTLEQVKAYLEAIKPYTTKVSKTTVVHFVNSPPKSILELQVIMGERIYELTDHEIEQVIKHSLEIFPDL